MNKQTVEEILNIEPIEISNAYILDELPDITWIWQDWIPRGMVTLLVGQSGIGKTMLALYIMKALTNDTPLPDGSLIPDDSKGLGVFLESESALVVLKDKLKKSKINRSNLLIPNFESDLLRHLDILKDEESKFIFETYAKEDGVRLVVVDSLGGMLEQENKPEAKKAIQYLASIAQEHNIAILLVHHPRKTVNGETNEIYLDSIRGFSGIFQFCRSIIKLEQPDPADERLRMSVLKSNLVAKPEAIGVDFGLDGEIIFSKDVPQFAQKAGIFTEAEELVKDLFDGTDEIPAKEATDFLESEGISISTQNRVKRSLGIVSERRDASWVWKK